MSGLVDSGATHGISGFRSLLMAFLWSGAFAAVVGLLVATRPAVVSGFQTCGWVCCLLAKLGCELGIG
jgi:hypothetical protein